MTFQAIYRDGALYPTEPLDLPENSRVEIISLRPKTEQLTREEIIAMRPKSPRFTGEQVEALIKANHVSVGTLPPDFSRADIYSDHD